MAANVWGFMQWPIVACLTIGMVPGSWAAKSRS